MKMKKSRFFIVLGVMLLLFTATAWASQDTPAILASLDQKTVTQLDDSAISEIRGESSYVMVKLFPLNFLDFSNDCGWTWNPYKWRYGNYGGKDWSGAPDSFTVDMMDVAFQTHDAETEAASTPAEVQAADLKLLTTLELLPNTPSSWGTIYDRRSYGEWGPEPCHWFYNVYVSRISVLAYGGTFRFFCLWKSMPLTEYARRQAVFVGNLLGGFPSN
jgi:hypothetical protein